MFDKTEAILTTPNRDSNRLSIWGALYVGTAMLDSRQKGMFLRSYTLIIADENYNTTPLMRKLFKMIEHKLDKLIFLYRKEDRAF